MRRRVVVEINFNNYGMNPNRLTREWIAERVGIFRRFTLKSLLAQEEQEFLVTGKVAAGSGEAVRAELAATGGLPDSFLFAETRECARRVAAYAAGTDELFIARLDSDDLVHKTYIRQLCEYEPQPGTVALINQNGYLWDAEEGAMAPIFHPCPQFYVFLYSSSDYAAGHRIVIPGGGHGNVPKLPHEILKPRNYVNVVHGANVSRKKVPAKGRLAPGEIQAVLASFMGGDGCV
ncbi:hypothetical protein F4V43_16810 [Paenibacillus spiritus]|uniref:Glycosyltransferase family 2 protein n=1 Tax=Paenibacillus spiritus TaxID=2496557 RepID=A0A5J5FVK3_9BACL|nr:glycosyltransferase [Paenibacillus spiritus]KAA8997917.1 hypothetical protein F4V43_16810 [Paenibacillus spiritus]